MGFPTIVRGEDKSLILKIKDANADPFSLTGITAITVKFKKSDGTTLSATLAGGKVTILSAEGGKISVSLNDTETALLKAADKSPITLELEFGAVKRILNFNNAIGIVSPLVA